MMQFDIQTVTVTGSCCPLVNMRDRLTDNAAV